MGFYSLTLSRYPRHLNDNSIKLARLPVVQRGLPPYALRSPFPSQTWRPFKTMPQLIKELFPTQSSRAVPANALRKSKISLTYLGQTPVAQTLHRNPSLHGFPSPSRDHWISSIKEGYLDDSNQSLHARESPGYRQQPPAKRFRRSRLEPSPVHLLSSRQTPIDLVRPNPRRERVLRPVSDVMNTAVETP